MGLTPKQKREFLLKKGHNAFFAASVRSAAGHVSKEAAAGLDAGKEPDARPSVGAAKATLIQAGGVRKKEGGIRKAAKQKLKKNQKKMVGNQASTEAVVLD